MREVHYFIPENREELESLVGKSVEVIMNLDSYVMVYFGKFNYLLIGESDVFLMQDSDKMCRKTELIRSYVAPMNFSETGNPFLVACNNYSRIKPGDPDYEEGLKLLRANPGSWLEPVVWEATV